MSDDNKLDTDARYRVEGWSGIAVWIKEWPIAGTTYEWDDENECEVEVETSHDEHAIVVMVGDDREHTVDVDELVKLDDEAYCHVCGQVGCGHDGIER